MKIENNRTNHEKSKRNNFSSVTDDTIESLIENENRKKLAIIKNTKELERNYEEKVKQIRESGENKIETTNELNQKRLNDFLKSSEEKLIDVSTSAKKLQNRIEDQQKELLEGQNSISSTQIDNFQDKFHEINEQNNNKLEELIDRNGKAIQKFSSDQVNQNRKMRMENEEDSRNINSNQKAMINKQISDFEQKRLLNASKYEHLIKSEKLNEERTLSQLKNNHQKKLIELNNRQKFEYEEQIRKFKEIIENANKDFYKKYSDITKDHEISLKNVVNDSKKNLEKIRKNFDHLKNEYVNQNADPFYSSLNIIPKIKYDEKFVYVSIPVPEFEKDFILISGKGKTLRLSYNRDFSNEISEDNGEKRRYSKVEGLVKTFPIDVIVDDKKIEKYYDNGNVIFKIARS